MMILFNAYVLILIMHSNCIEKAIRIKCVYFSNLLVFVSTIQNVIGFCHEKPT